MAKSGTINSFQVYTPTDKGLQTHYHFETKDENGVITDARSFTDKNEANRYWATEMLENPGTVPSGTPPAAATSPAGAIAPDTGISPQEDAPQAAPSNSPQSVAELKAEKAGEKADLPGVDLNDLMDFPDRRTAILFKKARDLAGLPPDIKKKIEAAPLSEKIEKGITGVFGEKRIQARINRVNVPSERIYRGLDNNAYIVLGNDRVNHLQTGYGGKGHTQCDAIDICAGMAGHSPSQADALGTKVYTNPNFALDAARIYISQKTDIDENFSIGDEKNRFKSDAKSAVVVKADNVRLVGRESLKLVTNTDKFNSQGGDIRQFSGIHLMANNDEEGLQPLVLGENLAEALLKLTDYIESLAQYFHAYTKYQRKFNNAVATHKHVTTFFAHPTLPSGETMISNILCDIETTTKTEFSTLKHITNLQNFKKNYLIELGHKNIKSRFNKGN